MGTSGAIQVVWPKRWIADDFEAAGVPVVWLPRFDPVEQVGPIWWTGEDAAASIAAGWEVRLASPNCATHRIVDRWVAHPRVYCTVGGLAAAAGDWTVRFVKPLLSKITFDDRAGDAQVCDPVVWALRLLDAGVPPSTPVVHTTPVRFGDEWRTWVWDGQVYTWSKYADGDGSTWNEWPRGDLPDDCRVVAEQVAAAVPIPLVVDIGYVDDTPYVVEANPVWSSGFYAADMAAVARLLRVCVDPAVVERDRWEPDPWQSQQAEQVARRRAHLRSE
jgi:hypothetical protein